MIYPHRWRGIVPLVSMVALLVAACAGQPAGNTKVGNLTVVNLALDWYPNTNHTGIFVAQSQGFYQQHGLKVNLMPYGATAPETLVATGQAQFAISFEESVTFDRAQGQNLVSVAAIMQHDTTAMAALKSSGITRPADFQGKRYASFGDPAEKGVISIMMVNDGVSTPNFQMLSVQNADTTALLSHAADFVWIYKGVEAVAAQDKGIQLNLITPQDYGVPDLYSPVLITSAQEIQQHPDIVREFLAATSEGYTYAAQHPDTSVDMLLNGAKGLGGAEYDTRQVALDSQKFNGAVYIAEAKCWGYQTLPMWTGYPRMLYHLGVITDANGKPVTSEPDYAAMFTNDYLPACK